MDYFWYVLEVKNGVPKKQVNTLGLSKKQAVSLRDGLVSSAPHGVSYKLVNVNHRN